MWSRRLSADDPAAAHRLQQIDEKQSRLERTEGFASVEGMRSLAVCVLLAVAGVPGFGAEKKFDFGELREGEQPPGFKSAVTGEGKPGKWEIVLDEAPAPAEFLLSPQGKSVFKRPVLAQLAEDGTDEHFPLFIFDEEIFGDFSLKTKFKTVRGKVEQMAGIAFHVANEKNYYVVRASSLGNTFRFYKVVDGQRGPPVGPEIPISAGVWHELSVKCKGNQVVCGLDGKELINVTDKANPIEAGKIAYWTKSDSVSYFVDTKITYVPREMPAQAIVTELLKRYPRLLDLKIYVAPTNGAAPKLVATKKGAEPDRPAGEVEYSVITNGTSYYGYDKEKGYAAVTMPLRDRNGDIIAAARVVMKSFVGQTEQNALGRATPLVKEIQGKVQSFADLAE
jgi:hypothetical protein